MGTREAMLTFRLILEGRIRKNLPTFMGFIYLEKAFDNVDWNRLFQILKTVGMKYKDRRIVHYLEKGQKATIRVDGEETEVTIQKGVKQGCNLSPILFNLYIEQAIKEIKEKFEGGIVVQGEKIQTLRFADDSSFIGISRRLKKDIEYNE